MLSKWNGSSSSLSVGDEPRRPRLPVCDFAFVKEAGLLPLDSYSSELDDEGTSDGLRGGGVLKKKRPGEGKFKLECLLFILKHGTASYGR
jgi:hypothetical protein